MSKSTIGARSIEKQHLSCLIRKIECCYSDDKQSKKITLYERGSQNTVSLINAKGQNEKQSEDGAYQCWITNTNDLEYYFITNNKGKDIAITCKRDSNSCTIAEHNQYVIDYVDIDKKELRTLTKDISDGNVKLFYFNLFYRTAEYRNIGISKGAEIGKKIGTPVDFGIEGMVGGAGLGAIVGTGVGNVADIITSLRFIHLPRISPHDNYYDCHTCLQYTECPHLPSVPLIIIYSYPDIEFSLKIGGLGIENEYGANSKSKDKRQNTKFCLDFSVTYASVKKELGFENIEEKELDAEQQKGVLFYKSINAIAAFFKESANFAENLKEKIGLIYGKDTNLIKDVGVVGKALHKASTLPQWLSGSIKIEPSMECSWHYSVSDDLTKLGRNIKLELGMDCKGELTIDLIELGIILLKKSKDVTTVMAVTTTVASGGFAGVPALVIKFLVDNVVKWLINKFEDCVYCNLKFIGNVNIKACSLNWDTCKDSIFEGEGITLELKPEIILELGAKIKTSITLCVTIEGEVSAVAEAAISLTWKIEPCIKKGYLGVDNNISVNPFSVKVEYRVEASFEVVKKKGLKGKTNSKSKVHEWKAKEIKMKPMRWDWFKLYDAPTYIKK